MTPETLHELLLHERDCYRGVCEAAKAGGGKALDEQRERAVLRWETVQAMVVKAMEQVTLNPSNSTGLERTTDGEA